MGHGVKTGDSVETPRPLRFASGSPVVSVSELDDFTVHPMDPRWPTAGNRSWQTGLCRIQPRGWIRWTTEVVAHSQSFRWFGNWRDWHVRLVCGYSIDVIALQSMTDSERDASVDSWRTRCTSIGVLLTSLFFLVATFLSCECIASKSSSKCIRWNLKANHGFITVSSSVMFHRSADLFFPRRYRSPEILQLVCTRQMLQRLPLLRRHLRSVTVEHQWLTMMVEWVMWFTDTCW